MCNSWDDAGETALSQWKDLNDCSSCMPIICCKAGIGESWVLYVQL